MLRLTLKMAVVGAISLFLLLPTAFICTLTKERSDRRAEVIRNTSQGWGGAHVLSGPILEVQGKRFFPKSVSVTGSVQAESRHRGIFEVPFYQADLEMRAEFDAPALANSSVVLYGTRPGEIEISEARIGDQALSFAAAKDQPGAVAAKAGSVAGKTLVSLKFRLLGTQRLHFLPSAEKTEVRLSSNWPHPNFSGAMLPASRSINSDGFTASWTLNNRNPASVNPELQVHDYVEQTDDSEAVQSSGVDFFSPVDIYARIERAVKYAALFITLTFLTFFVFEAVASLTIHPVQYLFVGLALSIFFLLLLSLAEHIGFGAAYAIAASACVGLVWFYSRVFLRTNRRTAILGGILTALYGFLYVVLVLEQYSLLAGSVGLFIILAAAMTATRNIDWYQRETNS